MKKGGDPVALAVLLGIALLWYGGLLFLGGSDPARNAEERRAARAMAEAIHVLARSATQRGFPPDPATDPNGTGLIGLPFTPITTTLGSLSAKRTGAQPDAAALMVRLLRQAGVHPGDRVALDSSGSFPGFAIATLVAAKTLGAETVSVVSIGASTYGANRPDFTLADMLAVLVQKGRLPRGPVAVSPGGASDLGRRELGFRRPGRRPPGAHGPAPAEPVRTSRAHRHRPHPDLSAGGHPRHPPPRCAGSLCPDGSRVRSDPLAQRRQLWAVSSAAPPARHRRGRPRGRHPGGVPSGPVAGEALPMRVSLSTHIE